MNERIRKKILNYEATVRKFPETFGLFKNPERKLELLWHLKNGTLFNVPETTTQSANTTHSDLKLERQNHQRSNHYKGPFKKATPFSKTIQTSAEDSLNHQDEKQFLQRSMNSGKKGKSRILFPKQLEPHPSKLEGHTNQLKCCSTYQKNRVNESAVSEKINLSSGALSKIKQRSYNLKKVGRPLQHDHENMSLDSGQTEKQGKKAHYRKGLVGLGEKDERNREDSYIPWFLVGKIMVM